MKPDTTPARAVPDERDEVLGSILAEAADVAAGRARARLEPILGTTARHGPRAHRRTPVLIAAAAVFAVGLALGPGLVRSASTASALQDLAANIIPERSTWLADTLAVSSWDGDTARFVTDLWSEPGAY